MVHLDFPCVRGYASHKLSAADLHLSFCRGVDLEIGEVLVSSKCIRHDLCRRE